MGSATGEKIDSHDSSILGAAGASSHVLIVVNNAGITVRTPVLADDATRQVKSRLSHRVIALYGQLVA